jgi:hypothetical protein
MAVGVDDDTDGYSALPINAAVRVVCVNNGNDVT